MIPSVLRRRRYSLLWLAVIVVLGVLIFVHELGHFLMARRIGVPLQRINLLVNGKRDFPYDPQSVRFARRGAFYGDFTQRVTLGKGLDVERIAASYDNGVLELSIPYSAEVQPRKIEIDFGSGQKSLNA